MSIGDRARAAREEQGLDPRPLADIRADAEAAALETPAPAPPPAPVEGPYDALVRALSGLQPQQSISKADLAEVMQSNAEGMRKALKPENARHPDVSVFNPKGERDFPRPTLTRKTFLAGMELEADELDLEEIDLLNKFTHTKEARNGSWRAEMRRTSSKGVEELHISFPCATIDDRMDLPSSMKLMLQELHGGAQAVDAVSLQQRIEELERKLAKAG